MIERFEISRNSAYGKFSFLRLNNQGFQVLFNGIFSIDDYEYYNDEDAHSDKKQTTQIDQWSPLKLLGTTGRDGKKLYLKFIGRVTK